jgi:NhaP-type Na+/H+ and K+/H+ antiporter
MIILSIIVALSFIITAGSLLAIFVLGIILGPVLKKHDPMAYHRHYAFGMPFSLYLLLGYTRNPDNLTKLPQKKQWIFIALKHSIPSLIISFLVLCISAYIANPG